MKAYHVISVATGLTAHRTFSEVEALVLAGAFNSHYGLPWFTVTPAR